jgi:Coiled-coil domain-containing protein 124 /Oxs1
LNFTALWAENDKNVIKKLDKKQEEEKKRQEALKKKQEAKALLEKEEESLKVAAKIPLAKITRAQIEKEVQQRNKNIETINNPPKKVAVEKEIPLEENLNRVMADVKVATNIDEAIAVLSVSETDEDRHPEKRMKAAFKAYEETQLPFIKAENPSLKLSQLKQIIFKNWQKSPENPMNKM